MQRYEKYKNSGVEWIGEIPENWEMLSNKYIFKLKKNQVGKKSAEYELLSLTLKGIIKRDMENPEGKFPAEFDTYQEVKKGDFVFCLFDVEETPRTVGLADFDGMITGAYTVFNVSEKANKKFLYYFYLNLDEKKRLKFLYRGLRNTIPKDSFFSFKTAFPPIEEQQTIATFLDDKTAKIDQTIAIKQKEIELLKERRQILIQKAVTKGLDDTVKLKDSGVDWIGEIPEHWEVRKLKYLTRCLNTKRIPLETTVRGAMIERNYPYYGATGIIDYVENYIFDEETILIAEDGANLVLRNLQLIYKPIGKYWVNNHSHILKPLTITNKNYLSYLMETCDYTIYISGAAQPKLTKDNLLNINFLKPPKKEQNQIVSYLEEIEEKIAKAILLKQQEIEKLKEYKTVLIDQVVTGKVRVS